MNSQYKKVNYIVNSYGKMNNYFPKENNMYQYIQNKKKIPIINQPDYYEQIPVSNIFDNKKQLENNSNTSSNQATYYNSFFFCFGSNDNNYSIKLDQLSYENDIYTQNDDSMKNKSNTMYPNSCGSYSIIDSNIPLVNSISDFKSVLCEYNINYNKEGNSLYNQNLQRSSTPFKDNYSIISNDLSTFTINDDYSNKNPKNPSENLINNLKTDITYFQLPQTISNCAPYKNYKYLEEKQSFYKINNNSFYDLDNKVIINTQKNSPTFSKPNKTLNPSELSFFKGENSNSMLLHSNSDNVKDIGKFLKPSSNTALLSNTPISNFNYYNLNGSSSIKKVNISDFKDITDEKRNVQGISNDINHFKNGNNNPSINIPNNNFNQININLLFNQQSSLIKTKSNLIADNFIEERPSDNFSQYLFEQINKLRRNPQSFVDILKKAKNNIKIDKSGKFYYSGKINVSLYKGKEAFDEAILSLEKMKPMKPLLFKKELSIKIPNNKNEFKTDYYLRKKIDELIKNGVNVKTFWKDIIKDPEIYFLLMIVDDNPIKIGAKRKDILNPDLKFIGINSEMLGQNFVCYIVFSE